MVRLVYRLGQFPTQWRELNDRYRDTIRAFWRGDMGKMAEFATRLLGSRDIFPKSLRAIHSSVNFCLLPRWLHTGRYRVTSNAIIRQIPKRTVMVMAIIYQKNYGIEGLLLTRGSAGSGCNKTEYAGDPVVVARYPHLLAGDEMGRNQIGNNNAYCQDNRISWVNWQLSNEDEGC